MTVEEYVKRFCSVSVLQDLADDNPYWQKACEFYNANRLKKIESLSPKQTQWMQKIVDDLVEEQGK